MSDYNRKQSCVGGGKDNKKHFQNRKEKSTGILVGIILVFFLCHVFRLSIQVYTRKKYQLPQLLKGPGFHIFKPT